VRQRTGTVLGWVGLGAYVAVGVFPFSVSTVLVPTGAAAVLLALWVGGLPLVVRLRRPRPGLTALAAPAALLVWVAFVQIGSWLFGWTA
jgi:hypothetical protein